MNVQFYKGISDANAATGRNASGSNFIPDGSITFTNERHIWVKEANGTAYQYGGSEDDEKVEVTNTGVSVGGVGLNEDLSNLSAADVLKKIFNPEYAPKYTAYSAGSVTGSDTYAVGSVMPAKSSFTITGARAASAKAGTYTANGGTVTQSINDNSGAWNNDGSGKTINTRSAITISGSVNIAQGTDVVKSTAGKATNKTASNETTLLSDATVNSEITTGNVFKEHNGLTPSPATVYFAYPIYMDGVAFDLNFSATQYTSDAVNDQDANNSSTWHYFEVPSRYNNVTVKTENPTKEGVYDVDTNLKEYGSEIKHGDQTYKMYRFEETRKNPATGKLKFRLTFNIA